MRFQVDITGDFKNAVALDVQQNFFITIKCAKCNAQYKRQLYITENDQRDVKVRGSKYTVETYNLVVDCDKCDNNMRIKLNRPEEQINVMLNESYPDPVRNMTLFPIKDGKCHISTIVSDTAVVVDVDGLIVDVVDTYGSLHENCEFADRVLVEVSANPSQTVEIQDFQVKVTEL